MTKFAPSGKSLVYSTLLFPGNVNISGGEIAIDTAGDAYVVASAARGLATVNPIQADYAGGGDVLLAALNSGGTALTFSSYLGGPSQDNGVAVAVDASNNEYVTGWSEGNFPVSQNTVQAARGLDTFIVKLSTQGTGPMVIANPWTFTFSTPQALGVAAPAQTAILTNAGSSDLAINGITTTGDFSVSSTSAISGISPCGTSLAPGASCGVNVVFTPTASGTRTGTVTTTDNAPGSPLVMTATGTGQGPDLSLSPSSLNFAKQDIGTTSAPQTVTLTNSGNETLNIQSITGSGDFADTTTCFATLGAGASCTVAVTFTPTSGGTRNGTLTITDSALTSPQTVSLSGQGNSNRPAATLSPASLTFAAQTVGTTSAAQTITLSNPGTTALTISAITASGDFAQTNNCGTSLAAGANCALLITFTPTAGGNRNGTISIVDNATGSPQSATLSGTGADVVIAAATGSSTTSSVTAGGQASYSLTLTPVGGVTGNFTIRCAGAPTGAACTPNPTSVTLDGVNPATVKIAVTTTGSSLLPLFSGPESKWPIVPLKVIVLLGTLIIMVLPRRKMLPLVLFAAMALAGCGGSSSSSSKIPTPNPNATPPGNYTLTVAVSNGTISRSTNFTLTVK